VRTFEPNPRYLSKMRLVITLVAVLILLSTALIVGLITLDPEVGIDALIWSVIITAAANFVWWLPAMFLARAYFDSLRYEVQDDEVIVHVGIWTQSVKHVPYRTVTNLKVRRDILDRWVFNIGSLNIQTAGMSGTTGAEESLVGLPDVQEVYGLVATKLRQFRSGMAPTAAGTEEEERAPARVDRVSGEDLAALLTEVRAIRQMLQEHES
jgi:membrane protein YdbS with pleckstrin-like domain